MTCDISVLQIMMEYASYIGVPESDISEGRVYAVKQKSAEKDHLFPHNFFLVARIDGKITYSW